MKLGPILALFIRSLREEVRSKLPYIARFLLVTIVLFSLYSGYQSFSRAQGSAGLDFFSSLTLVNAIFITLAGIAFFSSAITEEKEEGTIALLRMTKLSPVAILLGKSTSRLFGATLLILAQLPFTLLAVSLGGVTQTQVFSAYATLLAWVFFLANLALFCSVVRSRSGAAAGLTVLLLLVMYLIPVISGWILFEAGAFSTFGRFGAIGAPVYNYLNYFWEHEFVSQLYRILSPLGYPGPIMSGQVWFYLFLGIGFFVLSWLLFNKFNREIKDVTPARTLFRFRERRGGGEPGKGALAFFKNAKGSMLLSPSRSWSSAVLWKDFHFLRGGWVGMLFRTISVAVIFGIILILFDRRKNYRTEEMGQILVFVTIITALLDMALTAARLFATEVKWKTLSGLVMLPTSTGNVAYQKIGSLLISMIPYIIVLGIGLGMAGQNHYERFIEALFKAEGIFFIATFLVFLHLTTLFSLTIKGGSLVAVFVAAVVTLLGILVLALLTLSNSADEGILVFFSLKFIGICAYMQFVIGKRLEGLAASE